jgi:hypothetical protein
VLPLYSFLIEKLPNWCLYFVFNCDRYLIFLAIASFFSIVFQARIYIMLFLPVPFLSLRGRYGGLTASSEICSTSTTVTSLLSKRENKEKDTTRPGLDSRKLEFF